MSDKTLIAFLTGIAVGGILSLLFTPLKGSELRAILAKDQDQDEGGGLHTFNISELTSENSVSLEEIKKHLQE